MTKRLYRAVAVTFIAMTPLGAAAATPVDDATVMTVYKSPSCGCCERWIEHVENNGFTTRVKDTNRINAIKKENGLPREMASCHTALIDGYVIEGHVPASDIQTLLETETPAFGDRTLGLAVPRMPHGSPGMETGRQDDYSVFSFTSDGQRSVFQRYTF